LGKWNAIALGVGGGRGGKKKSFAKEREAAKENKGVATGKEILCLWESSAGTERVDLRPRAEKGTTKEEKKDLRRSRRRWS